jgi:hypothetical protein
MISQPVRRFLHTIRLLEPLRAIKRRMVYIEHGFQPCTPPLLIALNRAVRWCIDEGIAEGSEYYEFGIYRGFALWYTQALAKDMGVGDMRFVGFDSFFGLPPTKGLDVSEEFREGNYEASRKQVEGFLTQYGVDWQKTSLVEGWFKDTLNNATVSKYQLKRCSLCVVDCDLYESAQQVLNFVGPLLADKAVILFDDWNSFNSDPNKGEQRAFREFLAQNPTLHAEPFVEFGGHGKGFVIRRRG